jgi:hypothetical protein
MPEKTEPTFSVRITRKKLEELRMLADWQLRELGFEPITINNACRVAEACPHGFQPGDRVRIAVPAGYVTRYNREEIAFRVTHYPYMVGVVQEPPNEGFPPDAVQVRFPGVGADGGSEGAIDACCLTMVERRAA